jgi:hypothetical protein
VSIPAPSANARRPLVAAERGTALLMSLLLAALVAGSVLLSRLAELRGDLNQERQTTAALARAKEALLAWSAMRDDGGSGTPRPGELPCPDTKAPGDANYGVEEGTCAAGAIGRLPWKTLGIEELRDGHGEPLWYAVSGNFRRRWGAAPSTNKAINSDTEGTLQVYGTDGTTVQTATAVAVIFAPGPPLADQRRSANTVTCAATGSNLPENRCRSNYLDSANNFPSASQSRSNTQPNGPFTAGPLTSAAGDLLLNDRLLAITPRDLFAIVERRVGKEAANRLQAYRAIPASNGRYPYPARYDAPGCLDSNLMTDCSSDAGVCRGRFPEIAALGPPYNLPEWSGAAALPNWFLYNQWGQTIYFAVGTNELKAPHPANCNSTLALDGTAGIAALLLTAGPSASGVTRPSINLADYLDAAANQDGWTGSLPAANEHVTPAVNSSNNRLFVLP